jgi:N-carbamoylputrescine amidase
MTKLKTAGIQIAPQADMSETLRRTEELIEMAVENDVKIVCLPQLFNLLWFPADIPKDKNDEAFKLAETEDGETITRMRGIAKKHGIVIIAPIFEKGTDGDDDKFFNTAFVLGTKGEVIGKYRKVHIPQIPLWEERSYFTPGDQGFPVFDTPFGKIGVELCWDIFFPECARIMALNGASIIFAPTASAFDHARLKWERAISAAAHANGLFIFRVNRVGSEEKQDFYGNSFCMRPDGEFLSTPAGSSEGVVLAEMDLSEIESLRNIWDFLKTRRPDAYGGLIKE